MKVLLTGASGFVGKRLAKRIVAAGCAISTVSRRGGGGNFDWSADSLERGVVECDAIVHIAGQNLFGQRWSARHKELLRSSRVDTTRRLAELAAKHGKAAFVNASAIGYYGPSEVRGLDESCPVGGDFLAGLCRDWEAATEPASKGGVRTSIVRIGVVLGPNGGALSKMLPPFKLGFGGPVGNGRQWFSWIHIDDLVGLFLHLLQDERCQGIYNGTAPNPVTNKEASRMLGKVLHRPSLLPVPAAVLRLALGEVSQVLLTGQHVLPKRALEAGFEFRFTEIEAALTDILGSKRGAAAAGSAR